MKMSANIVSISLQNLTATHAMMIAPVQHGFTVTLELVDVSVERVTME